jgi:hypothetical protein
VEFLSSRIETARAMCTTVALSATKRRAGATNGATCPTDSSRSQRSSIARKPLETALHVVQPISRTMLITRRSRLHACLLSFFQKRRQRGSKRVAG